MSWCRYRRGRVSGRWGPFRCPSRSSPPSLHPRRPPPSSGTDTKKLTRGLRPRIFGLPLLAKVWAGDDETKGGVDFLGQSALGPFQLVVNHFNYSSNSRYSSKTLPFWTKHHRFAMNEVLNQHIKNWKFSSSCLSVLKILSLKFHLPT